jgi:predicted metal-binding protein
MAARMVAVESALDKSNATASSSSRNVQDTSNKQKASKWLSNLRVRAIACVCVCDFWCVITVCALNVVSVLYASFFCSRV